MLESTLFFLVLTTFVLSIIILILINSFRKDDTPKESEENDSNNSEKPSNFLKFVKNFCISFVISLSLNIYLEIKFEFITIIRYEILNIDPLPKISDFIYDSDPENNSIIKDKLNVRQLMKLDDILLHEKKECGLRVQKYKQKELSGNDKAVMQAYERWRTCKEFFRSTSDVIYPDERELYHMSLTGKIIPKSAKNRSYSKQK